MKSKTKIEKQKRKKKSVNLVETINLAKKNKNWLFIAGLLSKPTKNQSRINLNRIDKESTGKETIVIPGKVLSLGNLTKKIKLVSYKISESALEKVKSSKGEYLSLKEEIKKNPKAERIKIIS